MSAAEQQDTTTQDKEKKPQEPIKPTLMDKVMGEAKANSALYREFLPAELVGGSIPHISGTEEESVWNAAVQACGTERIHFTYTIEDGKCCCDFHNPRRYGAANIREITIADADRA